MVLCNIENVGIHTKVISENNEKINNIKSKNKQQQQE